MSHLDEGQLHALLDGELDEVERKAAEGHLAACAECRREYAEARALLAGADDLVSAVALPARAPGATLPKPARPFRWRNVAWAASVVLAVGLGWLARADQFRSADTHGSAKEVSAAPPAATLADSAVPDGNRKGELDQHPLPAPAPTLADKATQPARQLTRQETEAAAASAKPQAPYQTRMAAPGLAKQDKPPSPPAKDAFQAVTSPITEPTDLAEGKGVTAAADEDLASSKLRSEQSVAKPADAALGNAAAPEAPALAAKEGEAGRISGFRPAESAAAARRDRAAGGFQTTPMEGAVRILGGSIRLVDGMTPTRVLVGPGSLVADADPGLEIIRVVYNDPPGRELWLDQQRPDGGADEAEVHGQEATTLLLGDTLVGTGPKGSRSLRWIHQSGFRLGLTGFLPADSLRALARRVQ